MNTIILTSKLNLYDKDDESVRHPKNFGNANGIFDLMQREIAKKENLLYITSDEYDFATTDDYANIFIKSFELTMPFKNYVVLDSRNEKHAKSLVKNADLIFLAGGHVPTQNKFFKKINLGKLLANTHAVIMGSSAGSMNTEKEVWSPPELDGESLDPKYNKYFSGLGYTDLKILPHYDDYRGLILDGKDYLDDIIMPDSYTHEIIAINDGSYILIKDNITTVFGETYLLKNGVSTKICDNDKTLVLK